MKLRLLQQPEQRPAVCKIKGHGRQNSNISTSHVAGNRDIAVNGHGFGMKVPLDPDHCTAPHDFVRVSKSALAWV